MPRKPKFGESIIDEEHFNELKYKIRSYINAMPDDGSAMFSEKSIAEEFKLTQTGSRRLLMRLEAEGLLRSVPNRGYRKVDYSNTTVRTHFYIRQSIEGEAARLAAQRATREDLIRMMLIVEEMKEQNLPDDLSRQSALDHDFHHALLEASHDNLLKNLYSMLIFEIPAWEGIKEEFDWSEENRRTLIAHTEIIEAIRQHDPEAAVMRVHAHLMVPLNNNLAITTRHPMAVNSINQGESK